MMCNLQCTLSCRGLLGKFLVVVRSKNWSFFYLFTNFANCDYISLQMLIVECRNSLTILCAHWVKLTYW